MQEFTRDVVICHVMSCRLGGLGSKPGKDCVHVLIFPIDGAVLQTR